MNFRSAITAIFTGVKKYTTSIWREIGTYRSVFSSFGNNVYANDVARSCIRSLAEHTSKANVKVIRRVNNDITQGDQKLQDMIAYRPNIFMNGKDFLYKIRTILEINNTVFIYIMRDELGRCSGLYPMPNGTYEAVDVGGNLYIKFSYPNGIIMVHSWDDLAVLRKDYNTSDVFGDSNDAILTSLELLNTTNQGMANAIKSTSNLRGILKSTKAMLSDTDVAKAKERFVSDYTAMTNESGIASLDSTQEFTPITMNPAIANYKSVEELRLNIHRYYGTNDDILMSDTDSDQREAFYESRIEPFLLALSLELTYKIYNSRMRGFGNEIMYESNRMSYMSFTDKISLVQMVDRGALTPNEWRQALNLSPIPGGDMPIRRLDTALTTDTNTDPNVKEVITDDKQGQTV